MISRVILLLVEYHTSLSISNSAHLSSIGRTLTEIYELDIELF